VTSLTLLLLVDAFRPDYLRDAPFLSQLAERSVTGRLRETFGFLPRAAYFGGLSAEQFGFTNMFCCDMARSPFAVARWLPPAAFTSSATAAGVRELVDAHARARVTPFAATYVSSLNIPPAILPHLAVSEREAPWSAKAGYRSVFHELDERGEKWVAETWPLTNGLSDRSDAGIARHFCSSLTGEERFAYCHLQALDAAGHAYGPEGAGLRKLVRETDDLVNDLVEQLSGRYDELKLIVFGDHGMVSVTRSVDVRPALAIASRALVPGVDYVYFLDSTMVRLWFLTERARGPLMEGLSEIKGLRWVDDDEKARHRIARCHPSNAHEIFLADPGVVVSPDFFASDGAAPRGMHGYDPDCRDNQGLFLAHASDIAPGDAGVVDATEIYDWTRECLGLVPRRPAAVSPRAAATGGRFTQSPLPSADASVAQQLAEVVERLQPVAARAEAIVLTGSFGRGEGGAVASGPTVRAINDFDVLVVGGPDISRELAGLGAELAAHVGLDFLDLAWTDGRWSDVPATMLNLDLRYGSQVLRGAPDVLEKMPIVPAAEISMHDALILLINRTAGVLSGLSAHLLSGGAADERARRYLFNQIVKALVAVGDTYLVEWHAYDASYRARRERFACLAPGAGVLDDVRDAVDAAYRLKVVPDYDELPNPANAALAASPLVLDRLRRVAGTTLGKSFNDLQQATDALYGVGGDWIAADNARLVARPDIARVLAPGAAERSIRQALYAAMPSLLAATTRPGFDPRQPADDVTAWLSETLRLERGSSWEMVRTSVVSVWLMMNH
jgi:hypothetical protein